MAWQRAYLDNVKASTVYLYQTNIKLYIAPHLGLLKLEALTPLIVQRFYNDLLHPEKEDSRPLPPKTIKNIHPLDEAQIAKFLKAIQGHLHEYLYQTALFMGLRQGEVLGLTWD